MSINVNGVEFSYGATKVLRDITFTMEPGLMGLVGANGAGKSTLLRILTGLARAARGEVTVDGESIEAARTSGRLALIPETPHFDPWLTVRQFLDGLASASGLTDYELSPRVARLGGNRLTELSLGQKRQVEFAAALMGNPRVILLDEPTNGLDPDAVRELRQTLLDLKSQNAYLIVSSHHLDELQRLADNVLLLTDGSLSGMWRKDDLTRQFGSLDQFYSAQTQSRAD